VIVARSKKVRACAFTILKRMARVSSLLNPVNSLENLYDFPGAARLSFSAISRPMAVACSGT
jgi:hypothetical protein